MASLPTKSFLTLVQDQVKAISAKSATLVNFTVGSVLRAIVEANAGVLLWIQAMFLKLVAVTRLTTSTGKDVDSWLEDFDQKRKKPVTATGTATFARFTATAQAVVPIDALVQTNDGLIKYNVDKDTANPNYNASLNGYVLAPGTASISVPIKAQVAGAASNVTIGAISVIAQAIPGVDTVTNGAAITNGRDAASDDQAKKDFVSFMGSLSRATPKAVDFAIGSVADVTDWSNVENIDYNTGAEKLGQFWVVIDDGTGTPTDQLVTNVTLAIEAYRGESIRYAVYKPTVVNITASATIKVSPDYDSATIATTVQTALVNYINGLALGESVVYDFLPWIIKNAVDKEAITDLTNVLLNSGTSDVAITNKQTAKTTAGSVTISIAT